MYIDDFVYTPSALTGRLGHLDRIGGIACGGCEFYDFVS